MKLKYSQVAQLSNFSNDKMVNVIKQRIAESENAAVALVFDDKLIVLDEDKEIFYTVDYVVNENALSLKNWEKIDLVSDNNTRLEEISENFFDPQNKKEITTRDLVEAFKLRHSDEPVRSLVNKTAIEKKSIVESNSRIKALREVRKTRSLVSDAIIDIMEDSKIRTMYSKINEDSPTQGSITLVDFRSPLSVSLMEEETNKVINVSARKTSKVRSGNIKKKVNNMWTSESFKQDVKSLIEGIVESDNANEEIEKFINQHVEILVLKESEFEDLILKTALMIGESQRADSLVDVFKEFYNLDETKATRNEYLSRNSLNEEDEEGEEEADVDVDVDIEDTEADKKKDKETTIDEDSINKILKVMNKIKDNLEEKSMESKYVSSFISALEDAKVGSIGEGKLKEILDFLNSIYEQAKNEKDSEE